MRKTIETKNGLVDLINQWKRSTWDFTLIKIYFENDRRFGNYEFEFYLIGLGIRISWTYDKKKNKKEINRLFKIANNSKKWVEI